MDTGRTDLVLAGRASQAGTPCAKTAPALNFRKSRRSICRWFLFISNSFTSYFFFRAAVQLTTAVMGVESESPGACTKHDPHPSFSKGGCQQIWTDLRTRCYGHVVRRLYGQSRRCGRLQDLSKIEMETGQDGIAGDDRWVFDSLGLLSGLVNGGAIIEGIEQPAQARPVRDVFFHFRLDVGQ